MGEYCSFPHKTEALAIIVEPGLTNALHMLLT